MSPARARPLGSTYRLQLSGIGFAGARALVGYLGALGIETLYVSPILAASPGSTHGYDVVDPTRLDPELGTPESFEALLDELDQHGMRMLVDIVPNHMAAEPHNEWWWDVLRRGLGSAYAVVFDIDWALGGGRVLLPVLAAPFREVLRRGELHVDFDRLLVSVADERFPIDPASGSGPSRAEPAAVLGRQHYRLALWRLERFEGNYRRFFDIDRLVGVRVEDPAVYRATHGLILELAEDRRVAGLRVDHIDGLADPAAYLARLRADLASRRQPPPAVLVEKILGDDEWLPDSWPVEGTTGYEFADLATRLFVDPAGAAAMERLGARVTGEPPGFDDLARAGRAEVLDALFPGQLDHLAVLARAAIEAFEPGNDLALPDLHHALGALTAHFDVYRTYIGSEGADRRDRGRIVRAAAGARADLGAEEGRALDAVVRLLVAPGALHRDDGVDRPARDELVSRWQQLCGAVAAKGVEDTACYRYNGLLASAEVGGNPAHPALDAGQLHQALGARARRSSGGLNALCTHDTKRSADVRARLAALSEDAGGWQRAVTRWRRRFAPDIAVAGGPDPHDELFLYQSLVGVWPTDPNDRHDALRHRVQEAMRKAARESKRRTSWLDPDPAYERALAAHVDRVFDDQRTVGDLDRLVRRVGPAGASNALAMVVLAGIAPGIPDLYQGTELWDYSLMDPDNRRSVDFAGHARMLRELRPEERGDRPGPGARRVWCEDWTDGRVKLWVTAAILRLRREAAAVFASHSYVPLETEGSHRDKVVAFGRQRGGHWVLAVVPMRPLAVAGPGRFALGANVWGDTSVVLPEDAPTVFSDSLSNADIAARRGRLMVGRLFEVLPVSVLVGQE